MARKHYIVLVGLAGYMPTYCEAHGSKKAALADAVSIAGDDMPRGGVRELRETGSVELPTGELVEINECTCGHPEHHSDHVGEGVDGPQGW